MARRYRKGIAGASGPHVVDKSQVLDGRVSIHLPLSVAQIIEGVSQEVEQLAGARYFRILWMTHDQAAAFLTPSANGTPAITSVTSVEPFNALQCLEAFSISLNTIVKHATREPEPLVLRCRSRTVANVDSMGLVVRM